MVPHLFLFKQRPHSKPAGCFSMFAVRSVFVRI